jgi:hypothetical protein
MRGLGTTSMALLALALGLAGGRVQAQPGYPGGYRPPFSPYLNLLRPGVNPALNYYGLVRPQVEFRNSIQGLERQVGALDSQLANQEAGASAFPTTGHPVQFMNTSHYFGRSPASGAVGGGVPRMNPLPR